ncbi:hypothetical protein Mp_8g07150 [Marchantia polymorpha subsp. ruderalis]|uniref:Uncharacterized protein n=1 Tax=Marchantia polymorpha TaxID=3197 RepID=A0A2R6XIB1_MARPO|nr:hypothetical protein MARPO_0013s0078 [Marchantia polymorpha]BBN18997.1 hypothetical protein Mp_8g07150 [Marchantia polymorpha subsp. ruderalis]|eukprot:PTQ45850.1 hypothetical protein MARPO_0013s0078 [Marchantia polymorpha]
MLLHSTQSDAFISVEIRQAFTYRRRCVRLFVRSFPKINSSCSLHIPEIELHHLLSSSLRTLYIASACLIHIWQ